MNLTLSRGLGWCSLGLVAAVLVAPGCPTEEPTYLALNEDSDCVSVDVLEEDAAGDDDDSAGDDDVVRTDITCCGGDSVIGEGLINPVAAPVGDERYAKIALDREAFEEHAALDEVVRATVTFDDRGVGDGEAELEQDGLDDTIWDGWIGSGSLGGVPRTDTLCFRLWGDEESEE